MRSVRQKNTGPELSVRRAAHVLGFRFRLHRRDLPGTPDLTFPRLRKAIFVHGCFWHRHKGCGRTTSPKTRTEFWNAKFARNVERDASAVAALSRQGWGVLTIWECEAADPAKLSHLLKTFLETGD
jgi:DNA mismatch endonuclease (patch repair protein)